MTKPVIRLFVSDNDAKLVYNLWQKSLGKLWGIRLSAMAAKLSQSQIVLIAENEHQVIGCVAASVDSKLANITVIMVDPSRQRQGLGSALLDSLMSKLEKQGIYEVRVGQGGGYFWPGVPTNLPGAIGFFHKHGFDLEHRMADMVKTLDDGKLSDEVTRKISRPTAVIRLATEADAQAVIKFENQYFPQWSQVAKQQVGMNQWGKILLAYVDEALVGTNFLFYPKDYPDELLWRDQLGTGTGGYGALGVNPSLRNQYIGMQLAVESEKLLREHGTSQIYLGWVFSVGWYERLGFEVWCEYQGMRSLLSQIK